MADDHFGFLDAEVPKSLTPPAGYEAVHVDGMTWPRQGTRREDTSWITVRQWAHLIAQFRALRVDPNVDVSDIGGASPLLLSTYLGRRIYGVLSNLDLADFALLSKAEYDPDDDGIIALAQGGTGVAATDAADLRDQLGITAAISAAIAALVDASPGALDTLNELAAALGDDANFAATVTTALAGKSAVGHGHAIADVTGLQAALDAITADAALPAGAETIWPAATPPAGWLEEDGSAVLIASYPDLAAALYCGDANNATAAWGYKATTNVSPGSNRSISGTYIVLPDMRGEFIRGWDHGRGVDSGRSLWSTQLDQMQALTGRVLLTGSAADTGSNLGVFGGTTNVSGLRPTSGSSSAADIVFNSAQSPGARTGSETRGRNAARMLIIKY
jgi:hypothetical protein